MSSQCDFCEEFLSGRLPDSYAVNSLPRERTILRRERAVVLATISPIVANHFLVIPAEHVRSRVQLESRDSHQVGQLIDDMVNLLLIDQDAALLFEHGIGGSRAGGCGVDHCHLHILPCSLLEGDAVLGLLSGSERGHLKSFSELSAEDSYAHAQLFTSDGSREVTRQGDFPSQFLRNLVEAAMGLPTSSWRDIVRTALLTATVANHANRS